jgi:hypothetical protein
LRVGKDTGKLEYLNAKEKMTEQDLKIDGRERPQFYV